jgi:hypothetical protein
MLCVIKGAFIHISTSSFPGDVGCHNHPLLGPSVPAGDPHRLVHAPTNSGKAMALIPFVTTHPQWHNIVRFWLPKLDFPRGHPFGDCSRRSTLNCRVLIGSWPSRLQNALCHKWCIYTYKHILVPRWCGMSYRWRRVFTRARVGDSFFLTPVSFGFCLGILFVFLFTVCLCNAQLLLDYLLA